MKMKKSKKIGSYLNGNQKIDVIQLGNTKKNQPKNNKGRYIHGNAKNPHFDTYPDKEHRDYEIITTISCSDLPEKSDLPKEFHDYKSYLIGLTKGTPPHNLEITRHYGSIIVTGENCNCDIDIGTPSPSPMNIKKIIKSYQTDPLDAE